MNENETIVTVWRTKERMKIRVYNVAHGEHIPLHLPLIVGDIDLKTDDGEIEVLNSTRKETIATKWQVIEGAFKVLVQLIPGKNDIDLKYKDEILKLTLFFTFPHFKQFVRPVYIVLADDDGCFQGPEDEDCSVDSALERIKIGAMLIQTFTAEKMKEHGFGRQTFQLECDANFNPVCSVFKSKLTLQCAQNMGGNELWNYFARELMTSTSFSNKDVCKWYCFMSFTRYKPPSSEAPKTHSEILKYTKGHTALGGGGLALFGTGNLHTWAAKVSEIYERFTDQRKIDRTKFMDDSAYREFYWANYATGLGASLHELGHTFDLAHTPSGIMARGFDDLHKVFTVQRSKEVLENGDNHSCNHKLSPSYMSASEMCESKVQQKEAKVVSLKDRRYKDICYGSPLKKPVRKNSNNGNVYIAPPPIVFKVETGFKPVPIQQTVSISMKNYDGSETHQTIMKDKSYETLTEVTLGESGQVLAKSLKRERHASSGSSSSVFSHSSQSPTRVIPDKLPNSPVEAQLSLPFQYADDGAHWYRASAVLLRFHRWFNKFSVPESKKNLSISGYKKNHYSPFNIEMSLIKSSFGLRLVEMRSDPEGEVFHHWEFLSGTPPTEFTLKESSVKNIPAEAQTVMIVAEDNVGNVTKKKVELKCFK